MSQKGPGYAIALLIIHLSSNAGTENPSDDDDDDDDDDGLLM